MISDWWDLDCHNVSNATNLSTLSILITYYLFSNLYQKAEKYINLLLKSERKIEFWFQKQIT